MSERRGTAARAGVYAVAATVSLRVLGIVRAVGVARLLVPDEVGRFALAAAAMGSIDVLTSPALNYALVQRANVTLKMAQTAWTASVLRSVVLCGLGLAVAPTMASLFRAPEAVGLMRALAVLPLLSALTSLAPWLRVRDIDLAPQIRLETAVTCLDVAFTIIATAITRSAWGLVIGALLAAGARIVGSYFVAGFRPAFRLDRSELSELIGFSRWVFLTNTFWFGVTIGDDLLVGRMAGVRSLGLYRVAYRLGHLPLSEVADSAQRVLFPLLSRSYEDSPTRANEQFIRTLLVTAGISTTLGAVLLALAPQLIDGLLGSRWEGAVAPVQIFAVAGVLRALTTPLSSLLMAAGKPQFDTALTAVSAVALLVAVAALLGPFGIAGAAAGSLLSVLASLPVVIIALRAVDVSPARCAGILVRRLPAAIAVGLVAWLSAQAVASPLAGLLMGSCVAGVAWAVSLVALDRPLLDELLASVRALRRPRGDNLREG